MQNLSAEVFLCEIAFLAVFPGSKIDFWPFLKLQKMEFGQKKFHEIDLLDFMRVFLAWTFLIFLAHCAWVYIKKIDFSFLITS